MRPRRLPIRLMKVMLALSSALFALGTAEVALRVLDWPAADPVWREDPATGFGFARSVTYRHIQPEYDVAFATNRLGHRDDELAEKHGPRVLVLGDSFTCGYGVEQGQTFADHLERLLGVDVVNAGVGGFETIHQVRYFETEGKKLEADLVVYAMYLGNDLPGNREWTTAEDGRLVRVDGRPALNPPREARLVSLTKRSTWLRRGMHAARRSFGPADREAKEWRPDPRYVALSSADLTAEAQADLAEARKLLARLRDEVQATGAKLVVVTLPTRVDVDCNQAESAAGCYRDRPTREVSAILSDLGIEHLSLLEPLRAERARQGEDLYFRRDGHLNPAGHASVGWTLSIWLENELGIRN